LVSLSCFSFQIPVDFENDYTNLGDTSTLAEPEVVEDLINNRIN